jgi:benzoyl-CoA reductase/2-hydroxyglutaryl-CoA dehydratase subunit BcrC/BadD/HgdB
LKISHNCDVITDKKTRDAGHLNFGEIFAMHICFPYSDEFINEVKKYQEEYKPKYTIIHSTCPVGTSRKCNAIHSPVTGVHPYLQESLKTFTKFLGGEQASEVADYFRRCGIKVHIEDNQETTELLKLLCTTKYGIDIEYVKDVKRQCDKYGVPLDSWIVWVDNYNRGYQKLGQEQYTRPNLIPINKNIGGHCVRNNAELIETLFTKIIKELNNPST